MFEDPSKVVFLAAAALLFFLAHESRFLAHPGRLGHAEDMSEAQATERRGTPRSAIAIDVEERTAGAVYFQRTRDVSVTGLHLESTLPHPPGTRVSLAMKLPGQSEEMLVEGEVVARHPEEIGQAVRFVALSARERGAIAALVARTMS